MKNLVFLFMMALVMVMAPAGQTVLAEEVQILAQADGMIDLNAAGAVDLQTLPGVGPAIAERIVAYREEQGGFSSVDDLVQVKGVGSKTLEKLRSLVYVQ